MLLVLGSLTALPAARAQVLDRVLAVVSGHVITASDVRAFLELGLTPVEPGAVDAEDRVLEHLIDGRLVLDEADRLLTEGPPPARIEAALDEVAGRFPDRDVFAGLLARTGLSLDDLRQILRDEARRKSYLRDRFGAPEPAEDDLRAQRDAAIEDWVAGLERRAPIARFAR